MPVSFWDNTKYFAASNSSYHDESFYGVTSFYSRLQPGAGSGRGLLFIIRLLIISSDDRLDNLSHTFPSS